MKTTIKFFTAITVCVLLFTTSMSAQDATADQAGPQFYVITTMHWDLGYETEDSWEDIEKEYLNKVTMKNEHILGSGFFTHRWTSDNSELRYVRAFANWDAIDKAGIRNEELEKEAWPDEAARDAFFKKQGAFYTVNHSDEIYAVLPGAKLMANKSTEDMILYLQTRHFAYPEDGSVEEFNKLRMEYVENVIHKNEMIKAYYPHSHAWGADRTVFMQAYLFDTMDDLENFGEKNGELFEAHWTTEASRKAYGEKMDKYLAPNHGAEIFTSIAGLSK